MKKDLALRAIEEWTGHREPPDRSHLGFLALCVLVVALLWLARCAG